MISILLLMFIVKVSNAGKEHISGACHDPLHFGDAPCNKPWSIRFHMDVPTETCLAFNFTGCGENWNNFATSQACYEGCLPIDHHKCPAATTIHKTVRGEDACKDDCDCGLGKYCNLGNGYGHCCETDIKEKVDSDYNPPCPDGQSVVKTKLNGITIHLLGKKCTHNFCPFESTCFDGNFFAACCNSSPDF